MFVQMCFCFYCYFVFFDVRLKIVFLELYTKLSESCRTNMLSHDSTGVDPKN